MPKNNCYWHVLEKDGDGHIILDFSIINAPMFDVGDTFVVTARSAINAVNRVFRGNRQDILEQEFVVMERNLTGLWTITVSGGFPVA